MRALLRPWALLLSLLSAAGYAQSAPDEAWQPYTGTTQPTPPPVPEPPASLRGPPPPDEAAQQPARPLGQSFRPAFQKEIPNTVSVLGAPTLGQWNRGESATLGFPLISLRLLVGLADRFDLGVGFDSFYTVMNEPLLVARLGLVKAGGWALSATLEGGYAWFTVSAARETRGPRWLTGRRNLNLSPALVASYQGSHPRAARLFFEARYLLTFDTEPYAVDPLGGVPPSFVPGHNVEVRAGAELPLSAKTSFVFLLGLEVHGRSIDAALMPQVAVGVVTSI